MVRVGRREIIRVQQIRMFDELLPPIRDTPVRHEEILASGTPGGERRGGVGQQAQGARQIRSDSRAR
jgi:hypothetical protein